MDVGTIVRSNERSWAIEIITQINLMLSGLDLKIKRAGGERTLSVNKKSMFPDVLLYADENLSKILQGWELKMPDVLITNEDLIKDATRKAKALRLNSFVIWNFTFGKLYLENDEGDFVEHKAWNGTEHIKKREDVNTYKDEWIPIIKDIIITVNEFLMNGEITFAPIAEAISDNLMTVVIERNKELVAENLQIETSKSMTMESRLKVWWDAFHVEYDKDETNMYSAYSKNILLNWTNRIMFANLIKKYHNCANQIKEIDLSTLPSDGNNIIDKIIEQGDFYNVFHKIEYNDLIPADTWIDIVDYNQFLYDNKVENIDQSVLQDLLEKTVNVAKREIRGQFATPLWLANLLAQITVEDWNGNCADLCSGTGTIAKTIIDNKMKRIRSAETSFLTTWISDKFAYPLQIANIALTSVDALNIPLNMFQKDIFEVNVGDEINIKNPSDGAEITRVIPRFDSIVSNLPFVQYNSIALDEKEYLQKCTDKIKSDTGITFKLGKFDFYMFLPFKIHELLSDNGSLGIIISNSWLGTDVGRDFFEALLFYYNIKTIILSGCGRWFENADVVATLLVLQKKEVIEPIGNENIKFCITQEDLKNATDDKIEKIVNSIVLGQELDSTLIRMKEYTLNDLRSIQDKGICLNALFHDVLWVKDIETHLVPITKNFKLIRGERTGCNNLFYIKGTSDIESDYLVPMLKTSRKVKGFIAKSDMKAFCCTKTIEELKLCGHNGALQWIRKFADENWNPVPNSINYNPWYQMGVSDKADFVTGENPDKRLFLAKLDEQVLVDQRLIALSIYNSSEQKEILFALLNSLYGMFAIEANGFGRGLGVLDISKTRFQKIYMINPSVIKEDDKKEIVELFNKVIRRGVLDVEIELQDVDREKFDRKVLQAIGKEHLYENMKNSLLSMQKARHTVR